MEGSKEDHSSKPTLKKAVITLIMKRRQYVTVSKSHIHLYGTRKTIMSCYKKMAADKRKNFPI